MTGLKIAIGTAIGAALLLVGVSLAQKHMPGHGRMHASMHGDRAVLFGSPDNPGKAWTLARGGLLYDNWWVAQAKEPPAGTHPAYPTSGKKRGQDTWRCKECHGWDYQGKNGQYTKGSHATGTAGIRSAAGKSSSEIVSMLRAAPHSYNEQLIGNAAILQLATFVSDGQHDTDAYIDPSTGAVNVKHLTDEGLVEKGRGVFQTTCATCHGFDGRRLNFGDQNEASYLGTEAVSNPWEVLHKIRNGHPGVEMISLRAFPIEDAVAALAYTRSLPTE